MPSTVVRVELVQVVDQRVFLAQRYRAVQQAAADNLHHADDLGRLEGHLLLTENSEDVCVANLDCGVGAAPALHPD